MVRKGEIFERMRELRFKISYVEGFPYKPESNREPYLNVGLRYNFSINILESKINLDYDKIRKGIKMMSWMMEEVLSKELGYSKNWINILVDDNLNEVEVIIEIGIETPIDTFEEFYNKVMKEWEEKREVVWRVMERFPLGMYVFLVPKEE